MIHVNRKHNGTKFNIIISDNIINMTIDEIIKSSGKNIDYIILIKEREQILTNYINLLMSFMSEHVFDCYMYIDRIFKTTVEYYVAHISDSIKNNKSELQFGLGIESQKIFLYYSGSYFISKLDLEEKATKQNFKTNLILKLEHLEDFPEEIFYLFDKE